MAPEAGDRELGCIRTCRFSSSCFSSSSSSSHPIPCHPIPSHSRPSHLIPCYPIPVHPILSHPITSHPIPSRSIPSHPNPFPPPLWDPVPKNNQFFGSFFGPACVRITYTILLRRGLFCNVEKVCAKDPIPYVGCGLLRHPLA